MLWIMFASWLNLQISFHPIQGSFVLISTVSPNILFLKLIKPIDLMMEKLQM